MTFNKDYCDETLDERCQFRMFGEQVKTVKKIVSSSPKYNDESHFYRCAVQRLIREEEVLL